MQLSLSVFNVKSTRFSTLLLDQQPFVTQIYDRHQAALAVSLRWLVLEHVLGSEMPDYLQ